MRSLAHFVFSSPSPTRAHYVALTVLEVAVLTACLCLLSAFLFLKYARSHIFSCSIIWDFLIVTCSSPEEKTVLLILEAVKYRRKGGDSDTHTKYQCVMLLYKEKNLALIWYFCFFHEKSRNLGYGFNNSLLNMCI